MELYFRKQCVVVAFAADSIEDTYEKFKSHGMAFSTNIIPIHL